MKRESEEDEEEFPLGIAATFALLSLCCILARWAQAL